MLLNLCFAHFARFNTLEEWSMNVNQVAHETIEMGEAKRIGIYFSPAT